MSLKKSDANSIVTQAKRIPKTESEALKIIGKNDLEIQWKKPLYSKASSFSKEQWQRFTRKFNSQTNKSKRSKSRV